MGLYSKVSGGDGEVECISFCGLEFCGVTTTNKYNVKIVYYISLCGAHGFLLLLL